MPSINEKQKETQQVKQNSKEEHSPQTAKTKNNATTPKSRSLMTKFAFIFALGALIAAAYIIQRNKQLEKNIDDNNRILSTQLETLEQQQAKIKGLVDEKMNKAQESQSAMQNRFGNLSKQLQTALSQKFYQNQDWLLLKARYYLELAQINAHWNDNLNATIALMHQADELLQQVKEPKILEIRQAIAEDIAQVQAIPVIDIAGVLSRLDAVQMKVNDLSVQTIGRINKTATKNTTSSSTGSSSWRAHLQDSMNFLGKLVVISRNDESVKPLMSPIFTAMLKESIILNLQEAQWAVLNKNPKVYQLVLKQAIKELNTNFNAAAQNTAVLIKELTQLQQIKLKQTEPALNAALPLLNQLIDNKESLVKQPTKDEQGGNQP